MTSTARYTIECEAGDFAFERLPHKDTDDGVLIALRLPLANTVPCPVYWYEPGDSYLYNAPEGGRSEYLGEVYNYG